MPKRIDGPVEVLVKGKFLQLLSRNTWEYADRIVGSGVVMIVACIENRILLVEQFRPAVGTNVIELPAGLTGDSAAQSGEAHITAAQRELIEETGYEASDMKYVCRGPASSGLSSEVVEVFVARNLKRVGPGGGDGNENITVHEVEIAQLLPWIKQKEAAGCLIDPKVFSGVFLLEHAK